MSRASKLNLETQAIIIASLREGNYREVAAAAAGVHRQTVGSWMQKGAEGVEPYASFMTAVIEVEAAVEADMVRAIRTAEGGKDAKPWQATAWLLERRFPTRWSGRVKHHVAEEIDTLMAKLKAHPKLHEEVLLVLSTPSDADEAGAIVPSASGAH